MFYNIPLFIVIFCLKKKSIINGHKIQQNKINEHITDYNHVSHDSLSYYTLFNQIKSLLRPNEAIHVMHSGWKRKTTKSSINEIIKKAFIQRSPWKSFSLTRTAQSQIYIRIAIGQTWKPGGWLGRARSTGGIGALGPARPDLAWRQRQKGD